MPILAKSDGTVIDGDLRLNGAIKEGMAEVPVIVCDGWTRANSPGADSWLVTVSRCAFGV